ncbi:MAG: hypothetical protein IJI57_04685 [Flexilinea sp.]|nr:hypothetical protein [Flexilinea sp.]
MTLEEAIRHCEEVARHCLWSGITVEQRKQNLKCANEHRQLAEWLKELAEYRKERE